MFSYDGRGRCVEINEYTGSGTPSSQTAFIWSGNERCETRNAASSYAVLNRFFSHGEIIGGSSYYFNLDHLGSIREMTNSAGTVVWQQSFDPWGVPTTIVGSTPADMGYAGYYLHSRSKLNLTRTRAYGASLGRFINRDHAGEFPRDSVDLNTYFVAPIALMTLDGSVSIVGGPMNPPANSPSEPELVTLAGIGSPSKVPSVNLYGYVGNNPLIFNDPSGRCIPCILVGLGLVLLLGGCSKSKSEADGKGQGGGCHHDTRKEPEGCTKGQDAAEGSGNGDNAGLPGTPGAPSYGQPGHTQY